MSEENELLQQYQSSLEDLKMNSRPMIIMLTILAEESKAVSEGIAQLIEKRIWEPTVPVEQKLIYFYLVDSICKNVKTVAYNKLFARNLMKNFCHVFEKGDEAIRKSLHKMKETWKPFFTQQTLRELDIAVHKLDPAWPVAAIAEADVRVSQMHINPKFIKKIDEADKQPESRQQSNAKLELERVNNKKRQLVDNTSSPERKRISPNPWNNLLPSTSLVPSSSSSMNNNQHLTSQVHNHSNPTSFASAIPGLGALDGSSAGLANNLSIPSDISTSISSIQQPSSVCQQQQQPIMSTIQRAPISMQPATKTSVFGQLQNIADLSSFLSNHTAPATGALNPQAPLNLTALNSFNSLANLNPNLNSNLNPNLTQNNDVDYRISNEFSNPMFNLIGNQPSAAFPPTQQQPAVQLPPPALMRSPAELKMFVDGAMRKLYYLDDHTAIVLMKCLADLPFEKLRFTSPTDLEPRLICFEGPPVNVYIDDRYTILLSFNDQWKTFYHLGIEQRIRFGGPAKEICLNAQTIQAKFGGDPVPCELIGDSLTHYLRLGTPAPKVKLSDELRLDIWLALLEKYPPINRSNNLLGINNLNSNLNNLNAINHQPAFMQAPIVSIAPQQMMIHPGSSVINPTAAALSQPNQQQVIQPPAILPSQPTNLPQQFIQPPSSFPGASSFFSGPLLANKDPPQKQQKSSQQQKATKEKHQNAKDLHQKHSESTNHGKPEKRTKKQKAAAAAREPYLELKPESLKIKRSSLIDSLYSGRQCTNCSLRFDNRTDKGKAKYSAHLDWHFRQNRKVRDNSFKTSHLNREWYLPLDLWLKYKEINMAEDNDRMQNGQFENGGLNSLQPNELDQEAAALPLLIRAFGDKELNKCAFCGDHFNEKWVDGVDEWRLENAVYGKDENGEEVMCHPTCLSDKLNKSIEDEATMRSEETILRISESMLEGYDPMADPTADPEKEQSEEPVNTLEQPKIDEESLKSENVPSINGEEKMESEETEQETPKVEVDESQLVKKTVLKFESDDEQMADSDAEPAKEGNLLLKNDKSSDKSEDEANSREKESSDDSSTNLNSNGQLSPKDFEVDLKLEIIGLSKMNNSEPAERRGSSPECEPTVRKIELVQTNARKPIPLKLNMKESNFDVVNLNIKRKVEKEANSPKSESSKSPVNYLEQVARDENVIYRGKEESALCSIM